MKYNYYGFMARMTRAIEINLCTDKRKYILQLACKLLQRFDTYYQDRTIDEWAEKFRLSKNILNGYLNEKEARITPTEMLKEYLHGFKIIQNEISGQLKISKKGKLYTKEELTIMIQEEGIPLANLNKLLNYDNKNINRFYIVMTIVQLVRLCKDINFKNYKIIKSIINNKKIRNYIKKHQTFENESKIIPFLIKHKLIILLYLITKDRTGVIY